MLGEWVGLSSLIATNVGINIGIYKYFNSRLDKLNAENDRKVNRIFERFDEHKKDMEEKFVRKDVCSVMHEQTANNLTGLETRMEKRLDKLEINIQASLQEVIKVLQK